MQKTPIDRSDAEQSKQGEAEARADARQGEQGRCDARNADEHARREKARKAGEKKPRTWTTL